MDEAMRLAEFGYRVHPLRGKVPLLKEWPTQATNERADVWELWRQYPDANIGIVTGDQGLFVLDVDVGKGGDRSIDALTRLHGAIPITPTVRTGGGGWHLYLKAPTPIPNSTSKLGPGLDVRGVRGQVVAPPSLHASGARYLWAEGRSVFEVEVAAAPTWLLRRLRQMARQPKPSSRRAPVSKERSDVLEAARRYLSKIPGAVAGSRGHDTTWNAAMKMVRGFDLTQDEAFDLLATEFNPRCQPPWSENELRHKVRSAAEKAQAEPGFLLRSRSA
jgi:hypothetical protein